jgi:hypothetical protein
MLNNRKFLLQELKQPNIEVLKGRTKDEIIKLLIYHFNCREKLRQQWLETLIENDFLQRQHELDKNKIKMFNNIKGQHSFSSLKTRSQKRHERDNYLGLSEEEKDEFVQN